MWYLSFVHIQVVDGMVLWVVAGGLQLQRCSECFLTHCYMVARLFWVVLQAQVTANSYIIITLHLRANVELRMFFSLITKNLSEYWLKKRWYTQKITLFI